MNRLIFLLTAVTFLSQGAAHASGVPVQNESIGPKSLAFLALQAVLKKNEFISSEHTRQSIDYLVAQLLNAGDLSLEALPLNFNNSLPITSEYVAHELFERTAIDYHQRDEIVETRFGRIFVEGAGFVEDRVRLFEALHLRPEIAQKILKKQKDVPSRS